MENADFALERTLNFRRAGMLKQGKVTIGGIKFSTDENKWACRVAIDYLWPEPVWLHAEDALEAFRECLLFASDVILGSTEDGWSVWWREEGDHGGLFYFISQ
jgi:hypothetical protein